MADVEGTEAVFLCNAVRGILPLAGLGARRWPLHPATAAPPGHHASTEPAEPLNAPNVIASTPLAATGNAPSKRLVPQTSNSHNSTPGSALLALNANSVSQVDQELAANSIATASTPCTNSSARSTTPTWQTSKAEGAGAAMGRVAAAMASKAVDPKPVERRSSARAVALWRVAVEGSDKGRR